MAGKRFTQTGQIPSPDGAALERYHFEGFDGIASGAGAKYIDLVTAGELVANRRYTVFHRYSAHQADHEGEADWSIRGFRWTGAAWDKELVANIAGGGGASSGWGAASLLTQFFTGPNRVVLNFNSDKSQNVYFWWEAVVIVTDTSAPLLP